MSEIKTLQKALSLLDARQRRGWLLLVPLAFLAGALESLGAYLVFTLIRLINDPTLVGRLRLTAEARSFLSTRPETEIVALFGVAIGVFYLLKNVLRFLEAHARLHLASTTAVTISSRLLQGYLASPYLRHLERNSSDLVRNIHEAVHTLCRNVLSSSMAAISETLLVLGVVLALVFAAPKETLAAGAFLAALTFVLLRVMQARFSTWGRRHHDLSATVLKTLQQGFQGIKEIKVLGRESFFTRRFAESCERIARLRIRSGTLQAAPRLIVETVFIWALVAVILFVARGGSSSQDLLPLLGLFAYALLRVLPSSHTIVFHFNNCRFGEAAVDDIFEDWRAMGLSNEKPSPSGQAAALSLREAITFERVSFSYPAAPQPALQDIDLVIRKGESVGFVGPTAAGKTTLIDLLLGLLPPTSGAILVDGRDIREHLRAWQARIGYVSQQSYFADDTLRRNIAFGLDDREIDEGRIRAVVEMAQLDAFVSALPEGLNTMMGEAGTRLSGGERQRIATARALYRDPEVLVFDEATSALDGRTEKALAGAIHELRGRKTIVIIAHRLSTVRACDRLVFLKEGRIADIDPYDNLVARNPEFRETAGLTEA